MSETMTDRELNAAVAEKVFGYHVSRFNFNYDGTVKACEVWVTDPARKDQKPMERSAVTINPRPFSTDIAAAFAVVEKMQERGFVYDVDATVPEAGIDFTFHLRGRDDRRTATHKELPRAICLSALAAVKGEGVRSE